MKYYTLKVVDIKQETNDTVTVSFKQPGLKKIKYLAGQYLTLIFRINNRRYIRPYSFSSAPEIDSNLEITVKRVPMGIVSNHIVDTLAIGDMVEVMEPMGSFVLNEEAVTTGAHIVLWGAGSGITPLMSILKYTLHKHSNAHVTLIYGNRSFDAVIFNDKIQEFLNKFPNNFKVWHFHTQTVVDSKNPYVIQGRINPQTVLNVIHSEGNLANAIHYVCGPVGLKESLFTQLKKLNVDSGSIHSEDFELVKDPAQFNDISTRFVNLEKDGVLTKVEVVKGKSILEAGLDSLLELSYSCQTGSCLVCRGKLLSGNVKTIKSETDAEELDENECLLCCSYPLTDDVHIAIT